MEAQGLQSAGADHAHATELMAEAGVTLPGDEMVPEGSTSVEAVEPAEAASADAAVAAAGPVEPPNPLPPLSRRPGSLRSRS